MRCKVFIYTGEGTYTLDVESDNTLNNLEEVAKALWPVDAAEADAKQLVRTELTLNIQDIMLTNANGKADPFKRPKELEHGALGREEGDEYKFKRNFAIGNMTLMDLADIYPDIDFPTDIAVDIHYSDSFTYAGHKMRGRVVDTNDHEVFYVSNRRDALNVSNMLKVRKALLLDKVLFDKNSHEYAIMQLICKAKDSRIKTTALDRTIIDRLEDFICERSAYNDVIIDVDGEKVSARVEMDRIVDRILGSVDHVYYDDPFIAAVSRMKVYSGDWKAKLGMDDMLTLLLSMHPEILDALHIDSADALLLAFANTDVNTSLKPFGINTLGEWLTKTLQVDPEFMWKFDGVDHGKIVFKRAPRTLEDRYGIGYDDIIHFDYMGLYRGYNVYYQNIDGRSVYYPSKEFLTEKSTTHRFIGDYSEVTKWIDSHIGQARIDNSSYLEFMLREPGDKGELPAHMGRLRVITPERITNHSLIEVLDIQLNKDTLFHNDEKVLLEGTIDEFMRVVNRWGVDDVTKSTIKNLLNTTDKVVTFLYRINADPIIDAGLNRGGCGADRSDALSERMLQIANEISSAKKRGYYILRSNYNDKSKLWSYNIIPSTLFDMTEARANRNIPVAKLIDAISTVLGTERYGNVKVVRDTLEALQLMFPEIEDMSTRRAFIRDNTVYINTTIASASDPLHEYVHILLAMMKSNPDSRRNYEQMIYGVASSDVGLKLMERLRERYGDISLIDLMEEVFTSLFSYYIMNNLPSNLAETHRVFQQAATDLASIVGSIFQGTYQGDVRTFFLSPFHNGFVRFNNEIASLLENNSMGYGDTILQRRISTWINEQLKRTDDERLIEKCK